MQRVHRPVGVDGAPGGDQRLRRDLAAEDALLVLVRARAPEQVHLERLELEELDQVVERRARCCLVRHPKNTSASANRSGGTVLS